MYKLEQMPNVATRISDNVSFSFVDESPFYSEYLAWLAEGNTPEPYIPPPLPPVTQVPALNGLKAINHAGLADAYTDWATSPDRTFLERAFIDKSQIWHRDDPILTTAAAELGINSAQLDDLFRLASTL